MNDLVARAKAALEGTTDAPWMVDSGERWINGGDRGYDEVIWPGPVSCMAYCYGGSSTIDGDRLPADMAFIAAARSLVPELVAEHELLVGRLKAFGRDCVHHGDMTPAAERMLIKILDGAR